MRRILKTWAESHIERNLVMMAMRLQGKTLREIGNAVGVRPECVRQRIAYFVRWGNNRLAINGEKYKAFRSHELRLKQSEAQKERWKEKKEYEEMYASRS